MEHRNRQQTFPARLFCWWQNISDKPEQFAVRQKSGTQSQDSSENSSKAGNGETAMQIKASDTNIRNRKTKHEGWVVIFPDRWAGMIWRSKEEAQRHGDTKHAIDIVKIEWEE